MANRTSQELRNQYDSQSKLLDILGFFLRLITLFGVIAAIFFILNGIAETKRQSQVNQQYIRCIVLQPATSFRGTPEQRAKAIDDCAAQSNKPSTTPLPDIDPRVSIITTTLILAAAVLASILLNSRRLKRVDNNVEDIHSEIKTSNSQSIAELADAIESRRIDNIPLKDQTQADKDHTRDMKKR